MKAGILLLDFHFCTTQIRFFFGLGIRVIVFATAGTVGKWEFRGVGEIR